MASAVPALKARRYVAEELLHLRTSLPIVRCVVRDLNSYADIKGVLRLPEEAYNDPERFVCKSQTLAHLTNVRKVEQMGIKQLGGGSSEESESHMASSVNLPRDTQRIQWYLRRRESSDCSTQPCSAPSGIIAQRSENFQRFYRAVVSPTHVRVTAGGRIVPNTRATAPPVFAWNKDNLTFDPPKPQPDIEVVDSQQALWQHSTTLPSSLPPALSTSFATSYNNISQCNILPIAAMSSRALNGTAGNAKNASEIGLPKTNGESIPDHSNNGAFPQPVKISHPSFFDNTKPFMFNGHVVYPLPAGHQPPPHALPVPFTVLGNPNFAQQHPAAPIPAFLPQQLPFPMGPLPTPIALPPMAPQPSLIPTARNAVENATSLPPYVPTSGAVAVSEITKFQINGLHNHLKYLDNQIANNKHQIDEGYMVTQRKEVLTAIKSMETMLAIQLAHEGKAGIDKHRNVSSSDSQYMGNVNIDSSRQRNGKLSGGTDSTLQKDIKSTGQVMFAKPKSIPVHISAPKEHSIPTNKTIPAATTTAEVSRNAEPITRSEPIAKSKLTAAAAKAPPFQPRAQSMMASGSFSRYPSSEVDSAAPMVAQSPIEFPSTSLGQPNGTTNKNATLYGSLPRLQSMHVTPHINSYEIFERPQSFHGIPGALSYSNAAPLIPSHAVPYLVGVLPRGVNLSEAKATDLVYSRPLTDEEVRARYLYWGKAPRGVQSGLPKFDGKDFYPPSPVKEISHREPTPNGARGNISGESSDFGAYFSNAVNGYETPVRAGSTLQNIATPPRTFLENGVTGFQSPSPRPSKYTFEAFGSSGFPPTYNGTGQGDSTLPVVNGGTTTSVDQDYSNLFLEPGVPAYIYSSPLPQPSSNLTNGGEEVPTTPTKATNRGTVIGNEFKDQGIGPSDSWGEAEDNNHSTSGEFEQVASVEPGEREYTPSETSTVEINTTTPVVVESPKYVNGSGLSDRPIDLSSVDQQNLFLHNMLRNSAHVTMAAPALLGAVSSATAQGYLPQYRGAAAASLAPAALSASTPAGLWTTSPTGSGVDKTNRPSSPGYAPLIAANFLPENRPLIRDQLSRPVLPSTDTMGAESYTRYLKQKADADQKIIQQGWNAKTTATGPVMGSDW